MAIIKKTPRTKKIIVDLTGPQGNAFWLIGYAKRLCSQLDWDVDPIVDDMRAGDYEHLISVFDEKFGEFVDLER